MLGALKFSLQDTFRLRIQGFFCHFAVCSGPYLQPSMRNILELHSCLGYGEQIDVFQKSLEVFVVRRARTTIHAKRILSLPRSQRPFLKRLEVTNTSETAATSFKTLPDFNEPCGKTSQLQFRRKKHRSRALDY